MLNKVKVLQVKESYIHKSKKKMKNCYNSIKNATRNKPILDN